MPFGLKPEPNCPPLNAPNGAPFDGGNPVPKAPPPNAPVELEVGKGPVLPPFIVGPPNGLPIDALKGFAAPPVICGRRPVPRPLLPVNPPNEGAPVGCALSAPPPVG